MQRLRMRSRRRQGNLHLATYSDGDDARGGGDGAGRDLADPCPCMICGRVNVLEPRSGYCRSVRGVVSSGVIHSVADVSSLARVRPTLSRIRPAAFVETICACRPSRCLGGRSSRQVFVLLDVVGDLRFDRCLEHLLRALAQDFGERGLGETWT